MMIDGIEIRDPVTVWDRWDKEHEEFVFNHISDGWANEDKPTPKFDSQNGWRKCEWRKTFAHLVEGRVTILA